MSPDIHTLTGAYAADALPEDERRFFEAHLAECDACAQEVAELQATAAILGAASYETPPPGMKSAVLAEIDQIRQEAPRAGAGGTGPGERQSAAARALARWTTNLALPAAAVVVIVGPRPGGRRRQPQRPSRGGRDGVDLADGGARRSRRPARGRRGTGRFARADRGVRVPG
jgi:anti-sigma-K factor RskA